MNICFLKGKIIEEIRFNFYIYKKKISVSRTKIELENKSVIDIKGYDEMADWMYQNLLLNDIVYVQGRLDSIMDVEIAWIYKNIIFSQNYCKK